jgi:acid phosphatase (class A)
MSHERNARHRAVLKGSDMMTTNTPRYRANSSALALLIAAAMGTAIPLNAETATDIKTVTVAGVEIEEIAPGLLRGYLQEDEQLDSMLFVLPAPTSGSARQALDTAVASDMLALSGTPRWEIAIRDADLAFPAAAETFSCALGVTVSEETTPTLYRLLWRSMTDIGLASYSAKNAYQRERPFMASDTAVCTPEDEEALREDGSYPSGHTAIGWGWALILTELAPDSAEAILARGRAFGESRNVCNVHWYSDVVAGRLVGAGAVARLHADAEFVSVMRDARTELERARETGQAPGIDCEAEAASLEAPT